MKNTNDFLKCLSDSCLLKGYYFKSDFNSNGVRSFFLFNGDKKIKYTTKFNDTCLENCQYLIFETDNLYISAIQVSKSLLTTIDSSFLSKEGLKLRKIFQNDA